VRMRVVANLASVNPILAASVADGLGIDVPPSPPQATNLPQPVYPPSPALSLLARPGELGIATRKIAVLIADGVDAASMDSVYAQLRSSGAVPRLVGQQLGRVSAADGRTVDVEISIEAGPSVLHDAVIVPDGVGASALLESGQAKEFLRDQFRHCKPIFAWGDGAVLLESAQIPMHELMPMDPSLILTNTADEGLPLFVKAVTAHRAYSRETDPPMV